jgi:pimeloyl-ACP methyl ester carboxylesterase
MTMPVHFVTGELDPVNLTNPAFDSSMRATLPGYRGSTVIAGAGHWVQQEKPAEFNAALLGFLSSL